MPTIKDQHRPKRQLLARALSIKLPSEPPTNIRIIDDVTGSGKPFGESGVEIVTERVLAISADRLKEQGIAA